MEAYTLWSTFTSFGTSEVKLTDKIKFQELIFPEGVLYDYSAFVLQ